MKYAELISGIKRFGSNEQDICKHGLGILPDCINEKVILAPWWEPSTLSGLGEYRCLSSSESSAIKVWEIASPSNEKLTFIKTGIGAPVLMDALLSLGVTKCKKIIFVGSVGALDSKMNIGDVVIPAFSVCGDGASRYIASPIQNKADIFGQRVYPHEAMYALLKAETEQICQKNRIGWHIGKTFSVDTIFAQYAHIDTIRSMGCNSIEMETAAAFRAANLMQIPIAAIFSVSDNTLTNKSLISGRTEQEMAYRSFVRKTIFPQLILNVLEKQL